MSSLSTIKFAADTPIGRDQQKKLTQILNNLIDLPQSTQFLNPVPWKALEFQLDDYLDIIRNPMNLYKVQQNMKNRDYNNVEQVLDHIQLIWDNCKQYNKEGMYFELAQKMQKAFKKMIKNYLPNIQIVSQSINLPTSFSQTLKKPFTKQLQSILRQPQTKQYFKSGQQKSNYFSQSKSQKQISEQEPEIQQVPSSQKNRLHQRLKLITQQQLAQVVILIQENCSEGFKHISGGRYQIAMDNIDTQTFKKISDKVDDFIENQKIMVNGSKKVKV